MKLKHMYGKYACLSLNSWRFKIIQLVGLILWGRKLQYGSWWIHAARTCSVILFKDGKLLLGRRANSFEGNEKYSTLGGFVDNFETFAQAISREVYEESNMIIPPSAFTTRNLFCLDQRRSSISEQRNMPSVSAIYIYHPTEQELSRLGTTHEVSEFKWVDEAEFDAMHKKGTLAFEHNYKLGKQAFAQGWHLETPEFHTVLEGSTTHD